MFDGSITIENLREIVKLCLLITAILAAFYYYKYRFSFLKYFLPLIWYDVLNEYFALYYSEHIMHNNVLLFNMYRLVEFSFYFLLYRQLLEKPLHKKIVRWFLMIYYISVFINCFIENFVEDYFFNTYFIGATLVIVSIVLYFSEILNSEKIININKSFSFWVSIAVFIIYITTIPFKVIFKYYQNSPTIPYIYISNYAVFFIFCLIISIGLIWSKKE